jgi:N-acetylglucosaminyl-diphospho-decaprenol L-rhamnosyltransferase
MHDLAVIIVSTNEARWLTPCLSTVFAHSGDIALDVVVANNQSTDRTAELIEREFPDARVVDSVNEGFSHANNRALMTCDSRYVLFLNPDTEIVDGTFADLVGALDARPEVGVAGVRHLTGDGTLFPTVRRFPNVLRSLAQALGVERSAFRPSWSCERELDPRAYDRELDCDWTSGAFMIARREALEGAGFLDERFFIYSEETDLCLRIKRGGWAVRHLPAMTIIHHAGKGGLSPKMEAQNAYARMQYAHKHFSRTHRASYWLTLILGHALRWATVGRDNPTRRTVEARALATLMGRVDPPFGAPPAVAVQGRSVAGNGSSGPNPDADRGGRVGSNHE